MQSFRFIPWREGDRRYLVLMVALAFLLGALLATLYVVFTVIRIDGDSMAPALQDEDRVLVTRGYQHPARGDVVAITDVKNARSTGYVKRVIALPGDVVQYRGDTAHVNGMPSDAAPAALIVRDGPVSTEFTVPDGHVVVLGDNRPVSLDSRFTGPVPLPAVQGKVVAIILPPARFTLIDDPAATP